MSQVEMIQYPFNFLINPTINNKGFEFEALAISIICHVHTSQLYATRAWHDQDQNQNQKLILTVTAYSIVA